MKFKWKDLVKQSLVVAMILVVAVFCLQMPKAEASEAPKGFYVEGTTIKDANGNDFVMRGINIPHAWFQSKTEVTMEAIAGLGCNAVRVVCADGAKWSATTEDELEEIISMCRQYKMVCVLEAHDATGSDDISTLVDAANYWISVKDVLVKNQDIVILNIANEWHGSWQGAHWAEGYETVLPMVREAGITNMIMVDCAGWGQYPRSIMEYGKEIFESDPLKNTVFSMHLYEYAGGTEEMVKTNIDNALTIGVPVCVGEFGQKHTDGDVDEDTILSYCEELGIGYLAWSWKGNNAPVDFLDLTNTWDGSDLTEWGERLFFGENGIKETAKTCTVFDGMSENPPADPFAQEEGYTYHVITPSNNTHHYFTAEETAWLSEEDAVIEVIATTKIEQAGWTNITLVGDRNGSKADIMYPTKAGKKIFSMKAADFYQELATGDSEVVFDNFHVYTWNSTVIEEIRVKTKTAGTSVDPTPVDPTPVDPTPVDPTPVDPTPVDPTPVDQTPVDPTPVDPTPVDPTPVDPTPVDPTPVNPTPVNPGTETVVLKDVSFGKSYDLSAYNYQNIKEIVVKFSCNSTGFSGAFVSGNWVQQISYCQDDVKDNTIVCTIENPQSYFTVYKWWSNATLEIESVELHY